MTIVLVVLLVLLSPAGLHPAGAAFGGDVRLVRLTILNQSRLRDADLGPLLDVARRIWTPYRIDLALGTGAGAISVVMTAGRNLAPQDKWVPVLGTTLFADGHAVPYIRLSLAAAEALTEDADIGILPFRAQSPRQQDALLVRMLGIVLAHELGHYLLDTRQHTSAGLLKAGFSTRELVFFDVSHLRLTPAQQRLLWPHADAGPAR